MPFLSADVTSVRFVVATKFLFCEIAPSFPSWEGREFLGFLLGSPLSEVLGFSRRKATITLLVFALDKQIRASTRVSKKFIFSIHGFEELLLITEFL